MFFHASHQRTHMLPINHDRHTLGMEYRVNEVGGLVRQLLLKLKPTREHIDDARNPWIVL